MGPAPKIVNHGNHLQLPLLYGGGYLLFLAKIAKIWNSLLVENITWIPINILFSNFHFSDFIIKLLYYIVIHYNKTSSSN